MKPQALKEKWDRRAHAMLWEWKNVPTENQGKYVDEAIKAMAHAGYGLELYADAYRRSERQQLLLLAVVVIQAILILLK